MIRKSIKAALPYTVPVMAGYIFLGIAFGFLMKSKGLPAWYPVLMSLVIYSGALEFAAIPLIAAPFDPLGSLVMGLMLSARHLFYGIPMLKKYKDSGRLKLPLMLTLTDETFSVSSTIDPPIDSETGKPLPEKYFYAAVSVMDYLYWNIGTLLGACFGNFVKFDTTGIDFALTALFIVLFVEQLKTKEGLASGFIGLVVTAVILASFGSEKMVVFSMIAILALLLLGKKVICRD